MYRKIVVPVDLAHTDKLEKALATAADLAKHYRAKTYYVGVTAPAPSAVAHSSAEYAEKLELFAAEQSAQRGLQVEAKTATSTDPIRDLDDALRDTIEDLGADLVVMASHVPGFGSHIFASNAGYLASHTSVSVFVVR